MSTLSSLISGGGGALPQIALTQSQTFVMPQDGNICIHVIGGGGAGVSYGLFSGGAGGYCKKNSLAVTTGGSFTVVVGIGGPKNRSSSTPNNGGNSTVAGPGLSATLTANGGISATSSASGAGGSASNGDVNNTGGAGAAYGGGAVGVYGTGEAGSNAQLGGGRSDAVVEGINLSGFGQITGGTQGTYIYQAGGGSSIPGNANASGALSGGGAANVAGSAAYFSGGDAYVGGGGGGVTSNSGSAYGMGGCGGDGLVLIQYLPS